MSVASVAQAQTWQPEALNRLADEWETTARELHEHVLAATLAARSGADVWTGVAGDAARRDAATIAEDGDAAARALVLAAVAARDGAGQIAAAQLIVTSRVQSARNAGFVVADDGTVTPGTTPPALLILLSGGDAGVASEMLEVRAAGLTRQVVEALNRLGEADADAAFDIREAFGSATHHLDTTLGNAEGAAWDKRIDANRTHIAQAIVDRLGDPGSDRRITFYQGLLGEIDDPAGSGRRIDRKFLGFDPARESLIELNGDLEDASSVAILVPGMNTTIEGSAADTTLARRFVAATRGGVAAITYLGGPFPQGDTVVEALLEAASPRQALAMAPRLVAFSRDVGAAVDEVEAATGRAIPVTYVGHSYGGSILGTAEALGLTADRTLYAAAAGAGFGVDGPEDWHNRNPDVLRFAMTAPGDPIQLVQGLHGGPHGADPDTMPGVIRLATGHYDDGRLMAGPSAHTDVLDEPASDAWRNVLAVITGDRAHIRVAS